MSATHGGNCTSTSSLKPNNMTAKLLTILGLLLFVGVGCPQTPSQPPEPIQEEKKMETSGIPDDGLDAALEELDLADTKPSGGWDAY